MACDVSEQRTGGIREAPAWAPRPIEATLRGRLPKAGRRRAPVGERFRCRSPRLTCSRAVALSPKLENTPTSRSAPGLSMPSDSRLRVVAAAVAPRSPRLPPRTPRYSRSRIVCARRAVYARNPMRWRDRRSPRRERPVPWWASVPLVVRSGNGAVGDRRPLDIRRPDRPAAWPQSGLRPATSRRAMPTCCPHIRAEDRRGTDLAAAARQGRGARGG
jgi:hypothetical protein